MKVSTADLSEIFKVTKVTIGNWVKIGCPKIKKNLYDANAVILWWAENIYEAKVEREERDEGLKGARQRYWKAKAEKEELGVAQTKGEIIPKKTLADIWCARISEVRQGLLSLPDRLPPVLVGKTQLEIREIIHKEVVSLLEMYSREGKYTPKPKKKASATATRKSKKKKR